MFFYLEWNDKRPINICILENKPEKVNFIHTYKIKKEEYSICGWIKPELLNYYPPKEKYYTKVPYLSSHLQKSVRRMKDYIAVKTAKHYIDIDLQSFLRRLPIIMLEDVTIHESIIVIIWLMIANTKGFQIKEVMVKWLLGVVYYLSNEKEKMSYENKDRIEKKWTDDTYDKEIINVLYSLRFRKSYGGMKGDMNMIEYYIHKISDNKMNIKNDKISHIKLSMEPLLKTEWIYQANDFHCNRYIITLIKKYHSEYSEKEIKELIWNYSSSYNRRVGDERCNKKEEKWDEIKKTVKRMQKSCIYY
tara:strand:+ start:2406 stop:3317 length:912 start_codon:yes stop_codon:yes gene_type:complete